ncbi:hypothetical protein L1787_13050 [Acuticoccus sp. M5D2P5]|uniref:hypothetical protein n=1 Tax=Acuticoccus kalidii TaxID=2910977 RepID=UPI001F1C45F7|nr:hypothetical protein [Acuticoccus kalidii]MCF3934337.1 hypothetical protein [Acuticoccus kalidii]
MASFLITHDLRKQRNYTDLYHCLGQWNAVMLLESVYLAELSGSASGVRDTIRRHIDADDGLAVIQLVHPFDWGTWGVEPAAAAWLKARSP